MRFRPYMPADKPACVRLFASNIPKYFAPHEQAEFEAFLDEPECIYFVVEDDSGTVIGCGGYYLDERRRAGGLCWGLVGNQYHHQGVGRFLLLQRLSRLCAEGTVDSVFIDTSQHTAPFFEKAGFVTYRVLPDQYAPGLHSYEMILKLDQDYCGEVSQQTEG